ncbi:hypothetical protein OHC33_011168 [Knufia fluminis]|uniref:Uncharacterized protein n=1 Tax=Knufia fluminis TaxID=191047 RepID=A0AAN8EC52_9EURO|nr:hypothetical protein OHC33_011168 [Knufia fluminis]
MASQMENELSGPFARIVEIVEAHYANRGTDVDEIKQSINRFLFRLRVVLGRLDPLRAPLDTLCLTQDPADLSDNDLICMVDADLYLPSSEGFRDPLDLNDHHAEEASETIREDLNTVFSAPSSLATPSSRRSSPDGPDWPPLATPSDNALGGQIDTAKFSLATSTHDRDGGNNQYTVQPRSIAGTQRKHHHRSESVQKRRQCSRIVIAKSMASAAFPVVETTPDTRDLHNRLSPKYSRHAALLEYMFAETANTATFAHFKGALQLTRSHKQIRLPHRSGGLVPLMRALEQIEDGQSALSLYRSMALLRVCMCHAEVLHKIGRDRSSLQSKLREGKRGKTNASRALDVLAHEARTSANLEEDEKQSRKRIQNHLAAGRSWSTLCKTMGAGILVLIPRVAPSLYVISGFPLLCLTKLLQG